MEPAQKKSSVTEFDELIRRMQIFSKPTTEEKFLHFLESNEKHMCEPKVLAGEVQRLQEQVNQAHKNVKTLEAKLKYARHILDQEKERRKAAEMEKNNMAVQIFQAMDLLGQGEVNKTKERLQQLHHSFTVHEPHHHHQGGVEGMGHLATRQPHSPSSPLSTITEDHDSADTILDVSQINITEEDDLEEDSRFLRSGKAHKRRSSPSPPASPTRLEKSGASEGKKKRRSGRRSGGDKHNTELKTEVTYYAEGEGVKRLKVDIKPSTSLLTVTATPGVDLSGEELSEPEANKSEEGSVNLSGGECGSPLKKPPRTPAPPPPTPSLRSHNTPFSPYNQDTHTPHQPYSTPTRTSAQTPIRIPRHYSASKVNTRCHAFVPKTAFTSERCQPCGKKIKFAKVCLKCRDCRAVCHHDCREQVPLPCVPAANTPNSKGQMGTIADYTPTAPPMVPALVVHCTNEVENRGLTEVGIYRQCGSEKAIKELKEQFLRGRGVPNVSQVDIHVVSGTLKQFLRSLKEPLITNLLWQDFTNAAEKTETQDSSASLYQAISELPQPNRDTLAWLICHLQRVAECPDCMMPTMNLARVFGPTVVGYSVSEPGPETMVLETTKQHKVMEKFLSISSDYWQSFIQVNDENTQPLPVTPVLSGSMLGGLPRPQSRRRSKLFRTPLQTTDSNTLPYLKK